MFRHFLVFGLAFLLVGCGARTEVAKEKILAQVDKLLGEIDVKKKEAQMAVQGMEDGIDKLKMGKIESKMRLTQVTESFSAIEGKIAQADKALGRLRDHLKDGKETVINQKKYSPSELKDMADKIIAARKKLSTEAEGLKSTQKRLDSIVTVMEQREQEGRERLSKIKQNLDEIDAKAVALKSMQEAANLSGSTETGKRKRNRSAIGNMDKQKTRLT